MKRIKENANVRRSPGASTNQVLLTDSAGNTIAAQRLRLLAALRRGPATTLSARREIDVLHVAARIMELRKLGHHIDTVWTTDYTSEGRPHRVARYVLQS